MKPDHNDFAKPDHLDFEFFDPALSWLSFNHRVLNEAEDKSLSVFERLRFLAIYKSNLEKSAIKSVAKRKSHLGLKLITATSFDWLDHS